MRRQAWEFMDMGYDVALVGRVETLCIYVVLNE